MKKAAILLVLICVIVSCGSLQTLQKKQLEKYENAKKFKLNNFRIYVFNICEKYKTKEDRDFDNAERFCKCPDDFYEVALQDKIMKVEELYLLVHRKTNMVLYLTTKSHKYIQKDLTGFLNAPDIYKDNIALEQIESIYIGKYDTNNNLIHFPSYKDEKDIILHVDSNRYPQQILFTKANIATAENNYDIATPIPLEETFKEDIIFKHDTAYGIQYKKKTLNHVVDRIFIISEKGEISVAFGFSNFSDFYKLKRDEVRYHPNYSLIETH